MESELITLGVLFFFAIVGGIIAKRVKQPTVLGLLLIGAVIGPNALGIVANEHWIELIIEIGAILILFVVGLEFDVPKLMKLGFKAFAISIVKVGIAFFSGFVIASVLGFGPDVAIFAGAILSFSSTVVIVKVLEQKSLYKRKETPVLLTVLIFEDVFAVLALIFFSSVHGSESINLFGLMESVIIALSILLAVYIVMLRIGKPVFKWLMKNSSDDITTFLALGFCAGFSALAYGLGLSPSAGAFLAGSIIASMPQAKKFEHSISPYVLIASSLFFIAMGTLVNFGSILPNIWFIIALIVGVFFSRFIAIGLVSYVFAGFKQEEAVFSSLAMLSVGEFALLVAKESTAFNLGVDIVTITSVLIFVSAIIMSLSIAKSKKLSKSWHATKQPKYISESIRRLAWYVRSFFDRVDTENTTTRRFKTSLVASAAAVLAIVYTLIGWHKLASFVMQFNIGFVVYLIHLMFVGILGAALYVAHKRVLHTRECLIRVLTSIDNMMNSRKTRLILYNLSAGVALVISGLFFPIFIFLLGISPIALVVSFALIVAGGLFYQKATRILHTYGSDKYTKGRLYHSISLKQLYKARHYKRV